MVVAILWWHTLCKEASGGLLIFSGRYSWPLPHTGPHHNNNGNINCLGLVTVCPVKVRLWRLHTMHEVIMSLVYESSSFFSFSLHVVPRHLSGSCWRICQNRSYGTRAGSNARKCLCFWQSETLLDTLHPRCGSGSVFDKGVVA